MHILLYIYFGDNLNPKLYSQIKYYNNNLLKLLIHKAEDISIVYINCMVHTLAVISCKSNQLTKLSCHIPDNINFIHKNYQEDSHTKKFHMYKDLKHQLYGPQHIFKHKM